MLAQLTRQLASMSVQHSTTKVCRVASPSSSFAQKAILLAQKSAFHASARCKAPTGATWGGGKIKSHSGTAKRFFPVMSKRRVVDRKHPVYRDAESRATAEHLVQLGISSPESLTPTRRATVAFKRGHTGVRHLNSKMTGVQKMRLRGTMVEDKGRRIRILRRLLAGRI